MPRRTVAATACAMTAVAMSATPATAWTDDPMNIVVQIASDTTPDSVQKVFDARDVVIGDGPELTAEDLLEPSAQCGAVEVDIDPDERTITVSSTEPGCAAGWVSLGVFDSGELWDLGVTVTTNELVTR